MGLLDPKSRVLDTFITEEGRIQLSQGRLKITQVAFSDASTFYEYDAASGSSDVTSRLYFEATSLPQDEVTFQSDDSGKLRPFSNLSGVDVINGKLVSGSAVVPMDGTQFSSLATSLLASSGENFSKLRAIASIDTTFEDDEFVLSHSSIEFVATADRPISAVIGDNRHVEDLPPFHHDPRLSHLPNYRLLPPVVRGPSGTRPLISPEAHSFSDSSTFTRAHTEHLKDLHLNGSAKSITMDPTSRENNVFMQMFEVNPDGTMVKLDVIRFTSSAESRRTKFFVGKIVQDGDDFKFFNLFTLVLE